MAVCRAWGTIVVFSAHFRAVILGFAMRAEDSFLAVNSHVALFSTFEACGPISYD